MSYFVTVHFLVIVKLLSILARILKLFPLKGLVKGLKIKEVNH